jgi:hypothetical protein
MPFGPLIFIGPFLIPLLILLFAFRVIPRLFRGIFRELGKSDDERELLQNYVRDVTPKHTLRRQERDLESWVFNLAYRLEGRVTLSDIIIETGLNMKDAEDLANGMVDGVRVRMEVNDEHGFVIYEFPEIIARFPDKDEE